jgi:hypothetical protein
VPATRRRSPAGASLRGAAARRDVLRAAIPSLHMEDPLDRPQLAALHGELVAVTGSAVAEDEPRDRSRRGRGSGASRRALELAPAEPEGRFPRRRVAKVTGVAKAPRSETTL